MRQLDSTERAPLGVAHLWRQAFRYRSNNWSRGADCPAAQ